MNTSVLFTGGRAPATLDLARQFKKQGYRVYVAESEPYSLTRSSNVFDGKYIVSKPNSDAGAFITELIGICKTHEITTIIPTCEETFHLAHAMEQFASNGISVFTSPISILDQLHNKSAFIELVNEIGLFAPKTIYVDSGAALEQAREQLDAACVLKPVYSRFSEQLYVLHPTDPTPTIAISAHKPWVVQQYIPGKQHCSYSVVQQGRVVAHGCYATNYAFGHATIYFEQVVHEGIAQFVEKIAAYTSFTGQLSFDFIVADDNQFYPIECNPRATSGVHLFKGTDSFPDCLMDANFESFVTPTLNKPRQMNLAMVLYGITGKRFLRDFRAASDVIWDKSDPMPAFDQYLIYTVMLWRSWRQKKALTTLLTEDIQWGGGHS